MKMRTIGWLSAATIVLVATCHPAYSQDETIDGGYGDWTASCEDESPSGRKCAIWQVASTAVDGPRLLHVEISFNRPFSGAELLVIMPLGISLHTAPFLHIDQKWAADFKLDFCLADGCYARTKLSPQLLEQFLHMDDASLYLKSGAGDELILPLSGTGSRAAFNSTE